MIIILTSTTTTVAEARRRRAKTVIFLSLSLRTHGRTAVQQNFGETRESYKRTNVQESIHFNGGEGREQCFAIKKKKKIYNNL